MTSLKTAGLRLAATLFVAHALWMHPAVAAEQAIKAEEVAKQKAIYDSKGQATPEGYVIGRSLLSYTHILPSEFNGSLAKLGANDRWLDIGAGEGRAILDYCTAKYDVMQPAEAKQDGTKGKARAIAISIEDRRTPQWYQTAASLDPKQIQYMFGKSFREYALEDLGRFQVITDVIGGMSYTQDLSLFMQKVLAFLDVNGTFYTVLQDVQAEDGRNKPHYEGATFLTEIKKSDGSDMKVCSWLKTIGCAEVTCEFKDGFTPPIEVYRVRKTCENVTVPKLSPIHYEAGTPPERRFTLATPTPARTEASAR